MQRIIIKSFGPIKDIDIILKDIIILNGLQSSGKSTIAKTIYLFKDLPNTIYKFLISGNFHAKEFEKDLVVSLRLQLVSIFGTTKHFDDFYIRYEYAKGKFVEIKKDYRSGHAYIKFSKKLKDNIKNLVEKFEEINLLDKQYKVSSNDFYTIQLNKIELLNKLKKDVKIIFEEDRDTMFIPAGRSLVSTLSGELRNIDSYNFDYLMKDFVQRIFYMRDLFNKDLDEILEDRKKLSSAPIDFKKIEIVKRLIYKILQGKYIFENGDEKIILDEEHFVKIKFASSGQQEVLWILNILYIAILENSKTFMVFEEPEAHLYPLTQYHIMKIVGIYLSNISNQGIITTHSPYIMSALNNLIYAHLVGSKRNIQVNNIINKNFWIDPRRISAYFVEQGDIINIIDSETNIIDTNYIDQASEILNDDFEKLLELDSE